MKRYGKIHEEGNITPLTLSINHQAMDYPLMPKLLSGRHVGRHPFCEYRGYSIKFFVDIERWNEASRYIVEQVKKSNKLTGMVFKSHLAIGQKILKQIQAWGRHGFATLSQKQQADLLKRLFKQSVELCTLGYVPALSDFNTFYFSNLLQDIIQSRANVCAKYGSSPAAVLSLLTTSSRLYPSDLARIELTQIIARTKNKKVRREQALERWLEHWFWLNYGHLGPAWTRKTVAKEIRSLRKAGVDLYRSQIKKEQALWFKRLRLKPNDERIIRTGEDFVFLKGYRQEIIFGVYALLHQAAALAAKKTGIDKNLLLFISISELIDFLGNGRPVSAKELKERQKFCVWVPINLWQESVYIGNKAKQYLGSHMAKEEKVKAVDTFTGQVAYPGQARGTAYIINAVADMKKVKGPFILVSQQTNPELLPAMKQARAFVTDHGGITSHASIVAREMKTPCVIGTRIATKVLKDGDKVEVDAERGIVRKIK